MTADKERGGKWLWADSVRFKLYENIFQVLYTNFFFAVLVTKPGLIQARQALYYRDTAPLTFRKM